MDQLFKTYLIISEDPEVGTNQTGDRFWWRVSRRYNVYRPAETIMRNERMVRNAIFRANDEIQKFQGYYLQEERMAGSSKSELDIISAALATYQSMNLKPFKYLSCWQESRHHPKYKGGVVSSSSKRLRSVALSDSASDEAATQLAGTNLGSPDAGPSSSRRPQGRKKAMANHRRAPTLSAPNPAPAPAPFVPPQPPTNSLWTLLGQLNTADRSNMTPDQLATHVAMIRGLRRTLGLED
ncbi:uncharacterized protein LOC125209515 [Salvia hispanica]|uniref:uncharacterized protein LOC125209515 n=1 Tax=Salvia hispanica TaxID=49212 RepID=UPI00200907D4|nr:uncharacterized protein LOC125209515 [Salvia hispanica]